MTAASIRRGGSIAGPTAAGYGAAPEQRYSGAALPWERGQGLTAVQVRSPMKALSTAHQPERWPS